MFLIFLFVIFMQPLLFCAAESGTGAFDEELPWELQCLVNTKATECNDNHYKSSYVDLRINYDLWSVLVSNKIFTKNQYNGSFALIRTVINDLQEQVNTLEEELAEYRLNINLFERGKRDDESALDFLTWLSTTDQRDEGIDAVRTYTRVLNSRKKRLVKIMDKMNTFFSRQTLKRALAAKTIATYVFANCEGEIEERYRTLVESHIRETFGAE